MGIMTVFDLVIFAVGIYMVAAALKMKRKGVISNVLITAEETAKCRDTDGFIRDVYWREAVLGGLMVALGVLGFVNDQIVSLSGFNVVEMVLLLAVFIWFQRGLNQARQQYISAPDE